MLWISVTVLPVVPYSTDARNVWNGLLRKEKTRFIADLAVDKEDYGETKTMNQFDEKQPQISL